MDRWLHATGEMLEAMTTVLDYVRIYFIAFTCAAFSALMPLLGGSKGIRPVKKLSGGMLAWLCVWVKMHICIWPS